MNDKQKINKQKNCPKCSGVMEKGILSDRGEDYVKTKAQWAKGILLIWGLEDAEDLLSYRCQKCGFVELYSSSFEDK